MKSLLLLPLLLLSLTATAIEATPQQKLAAAQAVTALVTGPIILPVAVVTGQRKELCDAIRMRPRSCFDDNSEGRDQCPCGNWLRVIPLIRDHVQGETK